MFISEVKETETPSLLKVTAQLSSFPQLVFPCEEYRVSRLSRVCLLVSAQRDGTVDGAAHHILVDMFMTPWDM